MRLMQMLYDYLEQHLSEPVLKAEDLVEKMGMSRTKVFYKIKALTGDTPNAFFKSYKLNRAAEMLVTGDMKFAYIADATGFSSTSHFFTSFKKQFGCTPGEYKQAHTA